LRARAEPALPSAQDNWVYITGFAVLAMQSIVLRIVSTAASKRARRCSPARTMMLPIHRLDGFAE
jgi:hypothetical protein